MSSHDVDRLSRIYRILCGKNKKMTLVVHTVATNALTDYVTSQSSTDGQTKLDLDFFVYNAINEMVCHFVSDPSP